MNIFVLDLDPKKCAQYHGDKHVVKMVLETTQILSTAIQELKGERIEGLYKPTHKNHPCTKWVMESFGNFDWLDRLGTFLSIEYTTRYKKWHKSIPVMGKAYDIGLEFWRTEFYRTVNTPEGLTPFAREIMTPFAQAMPETYRADDAVEAYRNYYKNEKTSIAKWTGRDTPSWWTK